MIPPPQPSEKDYSTCEGCRARDAANKKKRKREGAVAEELCPQQASPVMESQDGSTSARIESTSGPNKDSGGVAEDQITKVSTSPTI